MKKINVILSLFMFFAFASSSFGQISATSHDFVGATWNSAASNGACGPCHIPHGGSMAGAPLWSHASSGETFVPYAGNGTLDATDVAQPSGTSLMCLGCHDGVTLLDDHLSNGGTASAGVIGAGGLVGTSLLNDHPISFTYNPGTGAGLDAALHPSTDPSNVPGGTTIAADLLFGGQVECASCHDPHGVTGIPSLLRVDNSQSALCLACHLK